jgi:hypothetical protein
LLLPFYKESRSYGLQNLKKEEKKKKKKKKKGKKKKCKRNQLREEWLEFAVRYNFPSLIEMYGPLGINVQSYIDDNPEEDAMTDEEWSSWHDEQIKYSNYPTQDLRKIHWDHLLVQCAELAETQSRKCVKIIQKPKKR